MLMWLILVAILARAVDLTEAPWLGRELVAILGRGFSLVLV
jgi:hypothetical protein